MLSLWLDQHPGSFAGKRVLHFAPEEVLGARLEREAATYLTGDAVEGKAHQILDIEDIALESGSFDLVVCLHILEHVDDHRALAEAYRVLSSGGIALIMTPVVESWQRSLEERDVPGPVDDRRRRILYFGQHDHVRVYGSDIRQRIEKAGFELSEKVAEEPEVSIYGLVRGDTVFIAAKPNLAANIAGQ